MRAYKVIKKGKNYIVVEDGGWNEQVAGPYLTKEQAAHNLRKICWGETPENGIELI